MAMKYPEFKMNSRPTPLTGMVCDKCNEFVWHLYSDGRNRHSCGHKLRLATDIEKEWFRNRNIILIYYNSNDEISQG